MQETDVIGIQRVGLSGSNRVCSNTYVAPAYPALQTVSWTMMVTSSLPHYKPVLYLKSLLLLYKSITTTLSERWLTII
jgi:hypothetical protein